MESIGKALMILCEAERSPVGRRSALNYIQKENCWYPPTEVWVGGCWWMWWVVGEEGGGGFYFCVRGTPPRV